MGVGRVGVVLVRGSLAAMLGERQTRFYRRVFAAAGAYNLAFGAWALLFPDAYFDLTGLPRLNVVPIWQCLGMVVGIYGFLYLHAARRLDAAWPIIAVGLLGKVLGPLGWAKSVLADGWPVATGWMLVFNDLAWWVPFGAFLWKTRPRRRARRA